MTWLVDTNVLSELRKAGRMDPGVRTWIDGIDESNLYTSVLVFGEIRRGIERLRRRDPTAAGAIEAWLTRMRQRFGARILPVDARVAERWGGLGVPNPVPTLDGLLAATALEHGLTLVTRNTRHVVSTGVATLNPFAADTQS